MIDLAQRARPTEIGLPHGLFAAVRLDRAFLPGMLLQGFGVIVHISCIQPRLALFEATLAYAAAKAALTTYSKGLSNEWAQGRPREYGRARLHRDHGCASTHRPARLLVETASRGRFGSIRRV